MYAGDQCTQVFNLAGSTVDGNTKWVEIVFFGIVPRILLFSEVSILLLLLITTMDFNTQ